MSKLDNEIPSIKLNNGNPIPQLAYGTGTAWYKSDENSIDRKLVDAIKMAIKMGYYHLDCAETYSTEPEMGAAIKEAGVPREQLFVTTKVLKSIADIPAAIDRSLKKLGLEYVDLYLIHSPFFAKTPEELQKAWAAMEEVLASGKAKAIGVSNYRESDLAATLKTAKVVPSVNQLEFHPYLQRTKLVSYMAENKIGLEAYAPLTPVHRAKDGPVDPVVKQLAQKYYVSEGEILLRWVIEQGHVAITTSGKEQRLSDMMRVTSFRLTPREVEEINEAGSKKGYRAFWADKFSSDDFES